MVFMWRGFTARGQGTGSVSTAVCRIQASKHYIESLLLVLKDRRSCFSQGERFTVRLPLDCALAPEVWRLIGIWKPSQQLMKQNMLLLECKQKQQKHFSCKFQDVC